MSEQKYNEVFEFIKPNLVPKSEFGESQNEILVDPARSSSRDLRHFYTKFCLKSSFTKNLWFFKKFFFFEMIKKTFRTKSKQWILYIFYISKVSFSQGIQPIHESWSIADL